MLKKIGFIYEALFANLVAYLVKKELLVHIWWKSYASKMLEIQKFIVKILREVMVAQFEKETKIDTFDFIHNKQQNMLRT